MRFALFLACSDILESEFFHVLRRTPGFKHLDVELLRINQLDHLNFSASIDLRFRFIKKKNANG